MTLTVLGAFFMAWAILRGMTASEAQLPFCLLGFFIGFVAVVAAVIERTPLRTWED